MSFCIAYLSITAVIVCASFFLSSEALCFEQVVCSFVLFSRMVPVACIAYLSITAVIVCASFFLSSEALCFEQVVCSSVLFSRMVPVACMLFSANSVIRW